MKKIITILLLSVTFSTFTFAKPIFSKSRYFISTYLDNNLGMVSPGTTNYPLIYKPDIEMELGSDTCTWVIKQVGTNANEYCFQNYVTKKYIKYNNASSNDRTALTMADTIQTDKSTSFQLELSIKNNLCYYIIRPVNNTAKVWDRRTVLYESVYPVGVYSGSGGGNECFIFYDPDGNPVIDDQKVTNILPGTGRTLGAFASYANTLSFNGKVPVVDTSKKEFYVSLTEDQMGTTVSIPVTYTMKNTAYRLYINNKEITSGSNATFTTVAATDKNTIEIRNGSTAIASGTLYFSCLPLVQIYTPSTIGSVYSLTKIAVTEAAKIDTTEVGYSEMRIRGASSQSYPKKSYAIKLKGIDGSTPVDRSFFGLRSDNNWILDAMYIDPSRMRNRVSTDLWEDFSTKPYYYSSEPKMVNGTRGHFVEVFMNDAYHGLYCMTEKVDRKQLKLKKLQYPDPTDSTITIQRGGLYKGTGWDVGTFLGNRTWDGSSYHFLNTYNNSSEIWSGYEVKYPDIDEGEPVNWKPLYDAIYSSSYLSSDANFALKIANTYDLPVFLDYYLLIELMLATDNQGKNTYMSVYDQTVSSKISITPWDMDGTWGRRWEGSSNLTYAAQDFDSFVTKNEHAQANLFLRLKNLNYDNYNQKLKDRYRELRANYFSFNSLISRFQNYSDLFTKSGAAVREKTRWSMSTTINSEMTFLSNWITSRLTYLDKQYLGGPYTAVESINASSLNFQFGPNPVLNVLYISGLTAGEKIQVISLQGNVLFQTTAQNDQLQIDMKTYTPGIYFLKAGSETAKIIKK